jgi:uncharacterized protein (DUF58 family)
MPRAATSRYLDLPALASLARYRFATRQRIDGAYSGRHRSRQRGGAGEFVDYREYSAGEDLRRLDWKVLARTGRSYLRIYQDETNLNCTLAVDASASMRVGEGPSPRGRGSKLDYVKYLTTALSHLIARGQDQVGLAVLSGGLRQFLPPGGTPMHVARLHEMIEHLSPHPARTMAEALRDVFFRCQRRGVLMLASDFLVDDLGESFGAVRLFRQRHWEVIVLHVIHPHEERLPRGAAFRFVGLEGEGTLDGSPAEISRQYEARFAAHVRAVRGLALAAGCDYRRVSTATPYLETLSGFLVERAG